jgi:hypothetical protein
MALRVLSSAAAIQELRQTGALSGVRVSEPISLRALCDSDVISSPIRLDGCHVTEIDAPCVQFLAPVVLTRCDIGRAQFFAAYFLAGLSIRQCTFSGKVDFQCSGHNRGGSLVHLEDNVFDQFVNFFDCWYEGPFEARKCDFKKGTNLLGNRGQPFEVRFNVEPVLADNSGNVAEDGEGAA